MNSITKIALGIIAGLSLNIATINAKDLIISGSGNLNDMKIESVIVSGSAEAKNSEFEMLVVSGSLDFVHLKVTDMLTVSGSAQGSNLECKRLAVSGHFKGDDILVNDDAVISGGFIVANAKMKGHTKISGGLFAKHSEFKNLELSSNEITLMDTTTHNITVEAPKYSTTQKIILKGDTTISGDVVFKSGKGEIVKDASAVIKGKVTGAKITS